MNLPSISLHQPLPPPTRSAGLTQEQTAGVDWTHLQTGNLLIEAVAGSGKTFTISEMIVEINLRFPGARIALMSFNSKVRDELKLRVKHRRIQNCDVNTVHGFGFAAFKEKYGSRKPNSYKLQDIFEPLLKKLNLDWKLNKTLCTLVGLAKDTGLGIFTPSTPEAWKALIDKHDLSWDEEKCPIDMLITLASQGFAASNLDRSKIDFSDMIYFPLLDNLPFPEYDFVFIDEAQDTNATRREVARRMLKKSNTDPDKCEMTTCPVCDGHGCGECCNGSVIKATSGRLIVVGDRHQAIYGFTGADNDALDILKREFKMTELPLSVCFRCSQAVITHARKLVSHIHAKPNALTGTVRSEAEAIFEQHLFTCGTSADIQTHAILCRKNAPLTSLAFRLLRANIPCRIEGRDIGQQLTHLCKKFKPTSKQDLTHSLNKHLTYEALKLSPYKFSILEDKVSCITSVLAMPEILSVEDFYKKIELLFSDYDPNLPPRLTLSSIHKSKGLEFPTVYLLGRNLWQPSPFASQPWMLAQENNLTYVAITRAKVNLIEVTVKEE
jgi:DNA helicase-2/ATP-dependent DNA helicase PcrA